MFNVLCGVFSRFAYSLQDPSLTRSISAPAKSTRRGPTSSAVWRTTARAATPRAGSRGPSAPRRPVRRSRRTGYARRRRPRRRGCERKSRTHIHSTPPPVDTKCQEIKRDMRAPRGAMQSIHITKQKQKARHVFVFDNSRNSGVFG